MGWKPLHLSVNPSTIVNNSKHRYHMQHWNLRLYNGNICAHTCKLNKKKKARHKIKEETAFRTNWGLRWYMPMIRGRRGLPGWHKDHKKILVPLQKKELSNPSDYKGKRRTDVIEKDAMSQSSVALMSEKTTLHWCVISGFILKPYGMRLGKSLYESVLW